MAETLAAAERFIFITQVYFCALYAVVLWDWLISLPREWLFIWKTSWTPVKFSYLFCRYWVIAVVPYLLYCFVIDHPLETCQRIYKIPVALALWNQVGSESILLIRTYAFFNRNIYVLWFLISALGGLVAYQLYVDTSQMLLLPFVKPPFENGPCFPMSKPHSAHLLGFFIAPLLFDTMVTFMTIWKAFRIRRQSGGRSQSRLIQTFLREGVFYYILISIANLVNGIFYLQPRQVISAINIPLSVMLGPILACRLILDLRERGAETVSHSESGIATFTTKPGRNPNESAFTSSFPRSQYFASANYTTTNIGSLSSTDVLGIRKKDIEQDVVEMADMHLDEVGMRFAAADDKTGELIGDDAYDPDAETYYGNELGFKAAKRPSFETGDIRGIRVDVEKTTTTM